MNINVSVNGYAKGYVNKYVATNVCGEIPPTVPVNIDCSLCKIGFPQAGGQISVSFYGPICPPSTDPSPSFWLGSSQKTAQFKCPNPGVGSELDPDKWIAVSYFSGISVGSCAQQYKMVAELEAVGPGQINISVKIYVLRPGPSGNIWVNYISFTNPAPLVELPNPDTSKYRSRAWNSGGYVPVTPQIQGGLGDPVSYVTYSIGTYSMRLGCGSVNNDIPDTCGMWDGDQWVTCFRGFIKSTNNTLIREFTQLGFNPNPCGQIGQQYCMCDAFTLTGLAPPTTFPQTPVNNLDPQFVIDYGVLGIPGGLEAVGARQQIQIGTGTASGIQVCVKQIDNGALFICTNDNGAGWICTAAVVENVAGPRILSATRANFVVYLYALNFPNPNILNEECYGSVPEGLPPPYVNTEEADDEPVEKIRSNTRIIIDRMRNPCIHLGRPIEDSKSCGCGTNVKFECKKHGVCRKIDGLGQVRQCINCEDYSNG